MARAKRDYGPDAMFVDSKPTAPELSHLGSVQVTFSVGDQEPAFTSLHSEMPEPKTESEITHLRRVVDRMYLQLCRDRQQATTAEPWLRTEMALHESGFESAVIQKAILAASSIKAAKTEAIQRALAGLLETRGSWFSSAPRSVLMLVGPPGAGKTTTLVKLAARAAVEERRRCLVLSLDTERVAATAMLQELSVIIGVPFQAVEHPSSLAQMLKDNPNRNLILIDTPGFGGRENGAAAAMANTIRTSAPQIETHLVLPATMQHQDLTKVAKRFEVFHPHSLTFTRLDETQNFGCIWNETERWKLPVGFATYGQSIPEDIVMPKASDLAQLVLRGGVQ
jgi:flagellar biosynthesis protein FlhF